MNPEVRKALEKIVGILDEARAPYPKGEDGRVAIEDRIRALGKALGDERMHTAEVKEVASHWREQTEIVKRELFGLDQVDGAAVFSGREMEFVRSHASDLIGDIEYGIAGWSREEVDAFIAKLNKPTDPDDKGTNCDCDPECPDACVCFHHTTEGRDHNPACPVHGDKP